MKLRGLWAAMWPAYQASVHQGLLPGYRDWRRPLSVNETLVGGLSAMFFIGEPLYSEFLFADDVGNQALEAPRGYAIGFLDDKKVEAVPLYRSVGVKGNAAVANSPALPLVDWSAWVNTLGYEVSVGPYQVDGHQIRLPDHDPDDRAALVIRTVAHLEWQFAGQGGYLGGELLAIMLAQHARLDTTSMRVPEALAQEIRRTDIDTVTATSMLAAALAAERIKVLGPDHFTLYLEAATRPNPKNLFSHIRGAT